MSSMTSLKKDAPPKETFLATPLDTIPLNIKLPFPIYVTVAGKVTCFRNVGDELTEERAKGLEGKVDTVLIPQSTWNAFLEHLEKAWVLNKNEKKTAGENIHALLVAYGKHM